MKKNLITKESTKEITRETRIALKAIENGQCMAHAVWAHNLLNRKEITSADIQKIARLGQ